VNVWDLDHAGLKVAAKNLKKQNKYLSYEMHRLPDSAIEAQVEKSQGRLIEVWRSRFYLCQVYFETDKITRLSICRPEIDINNRRWRDGLMWDDLQQVKTEVGRGHLDAVEVYPPDEDVVNVANFRHLWVFNETKLGFVWRKKLNE
jgi:hypothetical protein